MTRLNVVATLAPKPTSVTLSELAIAAGAVGHGMTLCFEGFPTPVICQLWKYSMQFAGAAAIRHTCSQADIRKLAKEINQFRLVLVYTPRLRNAASWVIQTSCPASEGTSTQPALFCGAGLGDAEGDPGTTLVLRGDGSEQLAVARWLLAPANDRPSWAAIP